MDNIAAQGVQRFRFHNVNGYFFRHPQGLLAMGHTAMLPPWSDPALHIHARSEEYYFLLQGQLIFQVGDFQISLQPNEILMLQPGVPHAIIGGTGSIEHLGFRAPALDDKQVVGELKPDAPRLEDRRRIILGKWGQRIPLEDPRHKNCWLIGAGMATYPSSSLVLAYLDFPTPETANAGLGTRHQLHLHRKSWEYYAVLQGEKTLLIENELVRVHAGEMLEVPPDVKHTLYSRQAPFVGFTMRVPVVLDDKVVT